MFSKSLSDAFLALRGALACFEFIVGGFEKVKFAAQGTIQEQHQK
jgi:hypothetical protein